MSLQPSTEKYDMSKTPSKEKGAFFGSTFLVMIGFCTVIFIILSTLYITTLYMNKDSQASTILDIMKIFIGVIIGSIATKISEKHD